MFYLDPDRGRRRRAMTRDRVASTASAAAGAIQTARIDAGHLGTDMRMERACLDRHEDLPEENSPQENSSAGLPRCYHRPRS